MDGIRVRDVADVGFAVPDLALMRVFLKNLRLMTAPGSSDEVLRTRDAGAASFLRRTRVEPPEPLGMTLGASCLSDLARLARCADALIAEARTPGDGNLLDTLAGRQS